MKQINKQLFVILTVPILLLLSGVSQIAYGYVNEGTNLGSLAFPTNSTETKPVLPCPGCNPLPPLPGFVSFWNMRFQINFPNDWSIMQNLPNTINFIPPVTGLIPEVIVNWGYPAPSWILDKSAWVSNMTKQGIIVDRIDNTTTIANNTGLTLSFTDNNLKYSVALVKAHNLALAWIYVGHINDFPTYEDKANTMLNTLQVNSWDPMWIDSKCTYNTLFTNFGWWSGWHSGNCLEPK